MRYCRFSGIVSRYTSGACRSGDVRESGRGEGGQALVEFALVAPILLMVLTAVFSLGIAINQYEILTNAVSDGARAFALSRGQSTPALASSDKCAFAAQTIDDAATSLQTSNLTFSMTYTQADGTAKTYSNTCAGISLSTNDTIEILATYPVEPLIFGWSGKTINMQVTASEQIQ